MTEPESNTPSEPEADAGEAAEVSAGTAAGKPSPSEASPSAPPPEEQPPKSAPAAPSPEQRVADAQAEATRLRDQLLRTAADFDNYRKRTRRELEDAQRRGKENALKDLLPVFDNLERAASHADSAPDTKSVADGLRIVLKQFVDTLEKMGVRRVATVGLPFDPSFHEAIQHLPSEDHPAGVVLAEVQSGYAIADHLVRAALVVVSKGPPAGDVVPS